jgi:hypothetical protein
VPNGVLMLHSSRGCVNVNDEGTLSGARSVSWPHIASFPGAICDGRESLRLLRYLSDVPVCEITQ